ncbi:arsenate reductase [Robbsia andropogonis]|uniref:Arsenate reductase n=2 Tax=Robbsia andropogonis TaxID=28092 RepID=A0A0F5JW00_9BURK|nr:arsenate reductase (glutaredoxin) [Robbsia andropogonis]KKB61824.1 arsenate reductase [Robbsia andropogonis]MCP1121079.1 arsenate reductase (glutaredoxin) [Robbsia andropogonis]MCP1130872.1 arsenate reductase (glutaredoxin) [Robbsia andropogonis]
MPVNSSTSDSPNNASAVSSATIFHNSRCSTSRKTLALLQERGIAPVIVDYLKTPPTRAALKSMIEKAGLSVRGAIRDKEVLFGELGLADASDGALLDAMVAHPILINRPFVVTSKGVRLCRPVESVLEILP